MKITIVNDVTDIKSFLDKYYKPDRYTGRGEEYARILLTSHETDFLTTGYDLISHHDSVTGNAVLFGNPPYWVK